MPSIGGMSLQAHRVGSLESRVAILKRLVWKGDAHSDSSKPPIGGLYDPQMRMLGLLVTEVCRARDDMCELAAIYSFVKAHVRYTGDITYKDTFQSAFRTLQMGGGDCDDHAILTAVLAMENGFQVRFRITSNTGASWDHIYCVVGTPKHDPRRWITLDTTLPGANTFGKEPPYVKYRDFPIGEP